jgi:hypothetical protein
VLCYFNFKTLGYVNLAGFYLILMGYQVSTQVSLELGNDSAFRRIIFVFIFLSGVNIWNKFSLLTHNFVL